MKANLKKYEGYLYIAPWLIGILVFTAYPFITSFVLSLTDYNLVASPNFIGLDNYKRMINTPMFWTSFTNTIKYVVLTVPLKLAFALFIAYILNFKLKGVNFFRTAYYLPSILGGSVAVAVLWRFIFADTGFVNLILGTVGVDPISWLGDPRYAVFTISLLRVWQFGSAMVIFLAALKNIPESLYEAAKIDGATKMATFLKVTLPMITPVVFFNFIMQLVQAFQEFNGPYIITGGGPLNSTYLFPLYIYDNSFKYFRMGYGSALSWFLFVVIMIFTLITFRSEKYWVYYSDEGDE
ncbi:binding-protein-dependent transport systems inner membrane component [Alkaliphilus metalliredigens QYMF]|uniref:Binding-protein-dependent transport systems inner membrane component n=1 Tax=Alkaliphilus metalliredigens (strain QYMF) TaxID=293826 RepID=A6TLQ1_ALKMQ|nr:sugar ABC transporter permease [Alkaliphilus metalliredigens]ABR47119.1 binding-protein-dependent transport systems inner membrane component [Alkaliphilus metalliredigens QYMF]